MPPLLLNKAAHPCHPHSSKERVMGLVNDKCFQEAKERLIEQGDLLAKRIQLPRAHGWGVLWDPGDEGGEGGISSGAEDTSQAGRALPTAASSSYSHVQATCGSCSSDGNGMGTEPMRTRGGY